MTPTESQMNNDVLCRLTHITLLERDSIFPDWILLVYDMYSKLYSGSFSSQCQHQQFTVDMHALVTRGLSTKGAMIVNVAVVCAAYVLYTA